MRFTLLAASVFTMGILAGFVFFVLLLIAYWLSFINVYLLIGLTVAINILTWLISPLASDVMMQFFYKVRRVSCEEFLAEHREAALFLKETCIRHSIPVPMLRIIEDQNPTAYCFGSWSRNARLVVSSGIFRYLNEEEQKAVIAHELGHIVNRDFIVMTVAATMVQILYEIYYVFLRERRGRSGKKDITPFIGLISFVLYIIGSYLLRYLSRIREYLADRFSAEETGNPDALSMALVKIAYGIAAEKDSATTNRLLEATRHMGICDYKAAQAGGASFKSALDAKGKKAPEELGRVFLYDIASPWALISELDSTHPLTGKRIRALSAYARGNGIPTRFDFDRVEEMRRGLDQAKLYGGFLFGLVMYLVPAVAILAGFLVWVLVPDASALFLIITGAGFLIQGMYKFQKPSVPEQVTVLELMKDPYANPLRGRFVEVEGEVIGKADAGSYLGEDVTLQDRSGCLIALNYESVIPIIGNLYFALSTAAGLVGQHARATGWFRRSSYQVVDLYTVDANGTLIKSYARFWGISVGLIILVIGVALFLIHPVTLPQGPLSWF